MMPNLYPQNPNDCSADGLIAAEEQRSSSSIGHTVQKQRSRRISREWTSTIVGECRVGMQYWMDPEWPLGKSQAKSNKNVFSGNPEMTRALFWVELWLSSFNHWMVSVIYWSTLYFPSMKFLIAALAIVFRFCWPEQEERENGHYLYCS